MPKLCLIKARGTFPTQNYKKLLYLSLSCSSTDAAVKGTMAACWGGNEESLRSLPNCSTIITRFSQTRMISRRKTEEKEVMHENEDLLLVIFMLCVQTESSLSHMWKLPLFISLLLCILSNKS